ncbi:unnamed protein product [Vitrella brassicaformis CCMP3155]|uniref:Uncharacterized protein n=1 Tax=Vitrella brassicaformis (strain CCMP3155) TaxID=1169540 RepID=A0A0G4EQ58_VITBC|nr:unnamed protein product [Vitrella brassicaformis CCMP3155]|eukprot:CEL99421.1 unnamed protein product [Vitrella brassicaformis CCMP3155]
MFLAENIMLILLGSFAALTDWFSFWEMIIDEPSQYTIPLLCKRLLLASASVSTALLVLKWCLEYAQMNATLVQRKKPPLGDMELGEYSHLIDSGVDSQAATPRGPSPTAPIIACFYRPDPPRWLVRMITVLSGISVLNDSIDFINIVIILCAIGNPRSHAMGILISNLSLNLLNAIASAYKAMGFEASRERMKQMAEIIARRPQRGDWIPAGCWLTVFCALGVIGSLCAYWGWSWIGDYLWWPSILLILIFVMEPFLRSILRSCKASLPRFATPTERLREELLLFDYSRLGLLHVLIAELVCTTSTWITFFTIAVFNERVPTWLWRLYFLIPATETLILYPSLIATLEQKIDARAHRHSTKERLFQTLHEALLSLICNVLFLCYPTYQLQLLLIANIILTVAVVSCERTRRDIGLRHAGLVYWIDQARHGDAAVMAVIQSELKDVAALLKANGAQHSDHYYKYGGHINQARYAALLIRFKALIRKKNVWRRESWKEEPERREEIEKELGDEEKALEADLKTLAEAVRAETADGRVFASSISSSQGPRRLSLQVFLQENVMLILLGAFAALTDWFSFWEMIIDEPSQYTIPLLCKRLLLASASVSTALLVLKWCLEYVQMNATLVQRKKGTSADIELGEYSRLIDPAVDSQAATPRGPSPPAPTIARFHRPDPPRWLVRVITVLSGISVLNDSIDFTNVVIILCAIGNPRSHATGILISNLSLNLLNAIASAYKGMGFEASRERMHQLARMVSGGPRENKGLFDCCSIFFDFCLIWGT